MSVSSVWQDLRYGFRLLARSPAFTIIVLLILGFGIGINATVFSLIDAVLLRSLPIQDSSHLLLLTWRAHRSPAYRIYSSFIPCPVETHPSGCSFSYSAFNRLRSEASVFSDVAAFAGPVQLDLVGANQTIVVSSEIVSGNFFQNLGVGAASGRTLELGDEAPNAAPVVVLSYRYWQNSFGGDSAAIGKTLFTLNGVPVTIVGVAAAQFPGLVPGRAPDLWLPLSLVSRLKIDWAGGPQDPTKWWLDLVARLKTGIAIRSAQAAATITFSDEVIHGSMPLLNVDDDPAVLLIPAEKGIVSVGQTLRKPLTIAIVAAGVVLLIVCANVAGLMLARMAKRQNELAMRIALGAPRTRIVRQLLVESMLLSLLGGFLGVLFAFWAASALAASTSAGGLWPLHITVRPDFRVLAFSIVVSLIAGVLSNLASLFRLMRVDLALLLKGNTATVLGSLESGRRIGVGELLVISQASLSVVVLIGAGLMVRTLNNLQRIDPGFEAKNLLIFGIDPTVHGYKGARLQGLYTEIGDRLRTLPGVISASYSSKSLLSGSVVEDDARISGSAEKAHANMLRVGPDFFVTMHIPVLAGRAFHAADFDDAKLAVAVVNESFVRRFLGAANPLGMTFTLSGKQSDLMAIIGVVADTKYQNLRAPIQPTIYVPLTKGAAHFEVRTAFDPRVLIPTVRNLVRQCDKDIPVFELQTESEQVDRLLFQERLTAGLSSIFALVALILSCMGLYGLLSFGVTQRTHEIGVRIALGAQPRDVVFSVLRQGILLAIAGSFIGIVIAFGASRYLQAMLYGIRPADPLTFVVVPLLLILVALPASYLPARRAACTEPTETLRHE